MKASRSSSVKRRPTHGKNKRHKAYTPCRGTGLWKRKGGTKCRRFKPCPAGSIRLPNKWNGRMACIRKCPRGRARNSHRCK